MASSLSLHDGLKKVALGLGLAIATHPVLTTVLLSAAVVAQEGVAIAATLTNWQFNAETQQLEFTVPEGTTPRYFLAAQPARIIVDLPNTEVGSLAGQRSYSGAVRQVRVAQFQPGLTRIVMELSPDAVLASGQVQLERVDAARNRWVVRPLLTDPSGSVAARPTAVSRPAPATPRLDAPPSVERSPAPDDQLPLTGAPRPEEAIPTPVSPIETTTSEPPGTVTAAAVSPTTSAALPPLEPGATEIPIQPPPLEPAPVSRPAVPGTPTPAPVRAETPTIPAPAVSQTALPPSQPFNADSTAVVVPPPEAPRTAIALPPAEPPALPPASSLPATSATVLAPPPTTATPSPSALSQPLPPPSLNTNPTVAPPQITAVAPTRPNVLLTAGTVLTLRYPRATELALPADKSWQEVLVLDEPVLDGRGNVVIPRGSQVIGRFESSRRGSRFIAQAIALQGQNLLIEGESNPLSGDRQVPRDDLLRNSAIGAVGLGLVGILTGGLGLLGIAAGAAGGAATTFLTAPQPAVIQPNQVFEVRLTADVLRDF